MCNFIATLYGLGLFQHDDSAFELLRGAMFGGHFTDHRVWPPRQHNTWPECSAVGTRPIERAHACYIRNAAVFIAITMVEARCFKGDKVMSKPKSSESVQSISRERLAKLLNDDLSREYQTIISYVVYSQVLKGAEFMSIAEQLELHAQQELKHALIISRQIDYLGKMPTVAPKAVRTSENAKEMLRFDLENENETIRNYRARVRQCEELGEFAMAELIRQILVDEQDHQIDLATALGVEVPDVSGPG
jgi:bacterioferritin